MLRYTIAGLLLLFVSVSVVIEAHSKEDADKLILPETPPTIEYFRKTTVDKPVLQRLNFITDPEIGSLPAVSVADFKSFYTESYPVTVGLGFGSFGTFDGDLVYTSTSDWKLAFKTSYTDGEIPRLYYRGNYLDTSFGRFISDDLNILVGFSAGEKTIWTERKNLYGASAACAWYLRENMNVKVSALSELDELKGFGQNHFSEGDIAFNWQPFTDNTASIYARTDNNTGLNKYNELTTIKARYAVLPFSSFAIGAGASVYKDTVYPSADMIWHAFDSVQFKVNYEPGIEVKTFKDLFFNNYYEIPNFDILYAERAGYLKETVLCNFDDVSILEFTAEQTDYRNYLYRARVPGTDFVAISNADKKYVLRQTFSYRGKLDKMIGKISVSANSDSDMTFVPDLSYSALLGYDSDIWKAYAEYDYVSEMFFALGDTAKIPSYGDLSLVLARKIAKDMEVSLKLENILSKEIETQPDFIRRSATVEAGIKLRFQ